MEHITQQMVIPKSVLMGLPPLSNTELHHAIMYFDADLTVTTYTAGLLSDKKIYSERETALPFAGAMRCSPIHLGSGAYNRFRDWVRLCNKPYITIDWPIDGLCGDMLMAWYPLENDRKHHFAAAAKRVNELHIQHPLVQ
jgi:hypothetical protein